MKYHRLITILFFHLVVINIFSQINIRRITPKGGLSFQAFSNIVQDKTGNMWFGSYEGIYKYNGEKFIHYEIGIPEQKDYNSNIITSMIVDNNNKIWIGTANGLFCSKNNNNDEFVIFKYKKSNSDKSCYIKSLTLDNKGNIWLIDNKTTGKLDTLNHLIKPINLKDKKATCLYFDYSGKGYFGTNKGNVYSFNTKTYKSSFLCRLKNDAVKTILLNQDVILVGYSYKGLHVIDFNGNEINNYFGNSNVTKNLKSEHIRDVKVNSNGDLWIGTYNGLYVYDNVELKYYSQHNVENLTHNSIYSLYKDYNDGMWIGTWSGGLNYSHYADNMFDNFNKSNIKEHLNGNVVSSFCQNKKYLFIGTEEGGLNKYDFNTKTFSVVKLNNKINYNVKTLCIDNYGGLWVGTYKNGVFFRAKDSKYFINFTKGKEDGKHLTSNSIYSLASDKNGVWIGTSDSAVNFYSYKTNKISFFKSIFPNIKLPCKNVRSLFSNDSGLWIGTYGGLFHIKNNILTSYYHNNKTNSITGNHILHIVQAKDGNIWIATKWGGISIINPNNHKIKDCYLNKYIKNKHIFGILHDNKNGIWITTNNGIIFYDRLLKINRTFIKEDGIQGNVFSPGALFMDKENRVYAGGTNGFTRFYPEDIKLNNKKPNVIFDKIIINNKNLVNINNNDSLNVIDLKHFQNAFTINFTCDNYLLADKNKYKYRLLGFNKQWIDAKNKGTAVFTNIPSGTYIFEAKAANNDGIWNDNPAKLKIIVATPWWDTILAYIIYFLLLVFIIVFAYITIRERDSLQKKVFFEKLERKNEEYVHEMKLKFFTDISHEFRTPLTLISGPAKSLLKSDDLNDVQKQKIDVILRNTNRLLSMVNKVLDIRKAEKQKTKLTIDKFEVVNFINERINNFNYEAKLRNIEFIYDKSNSEIIIDADKEMLDKIIFNLLSNAFKYSKDNSKIYVSVSKGASGDNTEYANQLRFGELQKESFVEIVFKDFGYGIESENLSGIFNRFDKGNSNMANSTGIGLSLCKEYVLLHHGAIIAQSTPKKGSRFIVRLPISQKTNELIYGLNTNYDSSKKTDEEEQQKNYEYKNIYKKDNSKETILIVEDNKDLSDYLVNLLSKNYNTLIAHNGNIALTILENNSCELILSDVMMPVMDGLELCNAVKNNEALNHIPIILLTALASIENKITGLNKGADAYVAKPFDDDLLISQIVNLLTQRKILKNIYKKQFTNINGNNTEYYQQGFVKKVNEIIESNYSKDNFNVETLSEKICLHRSQLHRKLKSLTGYSATEYIRIYRLKKAAELLKSNKHSIDEVAYLVGFGSRSYFSRTFKDFFNISPKDYLKKNEK